MKKRVTRFFSALMSVLMLSSAMTAVQVNATNFDDEKLDSKVTYATGDLSKQMENVYDGQIIKSAKDYYALKSNSSANKLIKNSSSLPESIDNSQSRFFPVIGNQEDMGSCVGWAQTYYQFTYTMNKARGITTTEQNSFNPVYTYSLVCSGDYDMGSGFFDVATSLKETGAVPVSVVPITKDCTNWYAIENIRREALKYRVKDFQLFDDIGYEYKPVTSVDDEDLLAIKTALANGEILTFSTEIRNWVVDRLTTNSGAPENNKFYNQQVITKQIGADSGHRMTIVGYNDNIWTDINKNNKIDKGEMGALKIANSWGTGYCNDGFVWFAYDALNKKSCVDGGDVSDERVRPISSVMRIDVKPYDSTDIYLNFTINTADRTSISPYIIAEKDGTIYESFIFPKLTLYPPKTKRISFDGSTNKTSGTFLYPLDNIVEDISSKNISDYTWRIKIKDFISDDKSHTLQQAYINDESTGSKFYPASGKLPITVNNNEATVDIAEGKLNHAVVYYRGYEAPIINYKVSGSWKTAEMEENSERKGYVHKYVIDLGTSSKATLYFSDKNGRVDNNNGLNYTAYRNLNYYITDNVREKVTVDIGLFTEEKFLDVDTGFHFVATATGGFEPYRYKFVTENLTTGASAVGNFEGQKTSTYFPRSEGDYRITVTVEDYSGNTATKSYNYTVENRPFAIEKAELKTTPNILTGKEVVIAGNTIREALHYAGHLVNTYEIEISKNGKVCHRDSVNATKYSMSYRSADFEFKWVPREAGDYMVKVSADDKNGEYSEVKMNLTVKDFNGTIIGDADNDGAVKIRDATLIQKYCVDQVDETGIWESLADTDGDDKISIKDATNIQIYLAEDSSRVNVGHVNFWEPEPTTEPTTVAPTTVQPTTVAKKNIVTFTNSLNWSGNINCYYWSDTNKNMTTWPGKAMTYLTTNDFGQKQYIFEVPSDATYVIFTNGSSQTVDIPYKGGEVKYYAKTTMSNGAYEVGTW